MSTSMENPSRGPGGWIRSLGLTSHVGLVTVTLSGLTIIYLIYSAMLTPYVRLNRDTSVDSNLKSVQPPPATLHEMAGLHLPHQPWTLEAGYQLRTADAYIYTNSWKPTENDRSIRFAPFAMVWVSKKAKPGDEPLTVSATSAILRFDSEFKFPSSTGRIIGGSLQGDVRITGPDGLDVVGQNFAFSEQSLKVWSDFPVQFRYDGHRGSALGVQLDLLPSTKPADDDSLAVEGIRKVILRKNVSMDFELVEREADGTPRPDETVQVSIQCRESFDYVVETHLATYTGDVRVRRPTSPRFFDRLTCDQLTIQFRPAETTGNQPSTEAQLLTANQPIQLPDQPPAPTEANEEDLEFDRLRAVGRRVVLSSDENELTAVMSELVYDGPRRVVLLKDGDSVQAQHKTTQLQCPQVTLEHDEEGQIRSAWCRGTGWMRNLDSMTRDVQFAAQWTRELRKYVEPESALDVIELDGDAVVRQPQEQVGLGADFIKLWYQELPPQPGVEQAAEAAQTALAESESTLGGGRYRPVRLLATDRVAVASPEARGETSRVEVWFADSPAGTQAIQQTTAVGPPLAASAASDGVPNEPGGRTGPRPERDREPPEFPLEIVSDLIQVRAEFSPAGGPSDLQITDIWTEGHVEIRQEHAQDDPLQITGHRLQIKNSGPEREVVHIFGEPAHVRDRGLHIEGEEIHLDRERNLMWVQGAGLLQLPVKEDLEGQPLETAQTLDIWWIDQMTFDGRTARFFGNVRTVLNDNRMRCQEMHVLLTKKLSFSDPQTIPADAGAAEQRMVDIYSILCSDGVDFRGYEYNKSRLVSIRHGRCAHLAMNHDTGETEASGPGWLTTWQRGQGTRAALGPAAEARANQPLESSDKENSWEYTHVEFVGHAKGNLHDQNTLFTDQVRIVYGPVDRPLGVINPEQLPADGLPEQAGIMRCSKLRIVAHEQPASDKRMFELLASGDAFLEGRNFHAQADTISFDESKELYILRSIEPRKAMIWRQGSIGQEFSPVVAQRMEFSPKRNRLKFDRTTALQGLQ